MQQKAEPASTNSVMKVVAQISNSNEFNNLDCLTSRIFTQSQGTVEKPLSSVLSFVLIATKFPFSLS